LSEPRIEIRAGRASELRRGQTWLVALPPLPWDMHREAIVLRDDGDRVRAYLNRCKHLPVPLDGGTRELFDSTKRFLLCGTHGALYELATGFCISGPCRGKELTPIAIEERDGDLLLVVAE
jgi:nitrite reductase/ring-hydroxylating ferredoxin subunit